MPGRNPYNPFNCLFDDVSNVHTHHDGKPIISTYARLFRSSIKEKIDCTLEVFSGTVNLCDALDLKTFSIPEQQWGILDYIGFILFRFLRLACTALVNYLREHGRPYGLFGILFVVTILVAVSVFSIDIGIRYGLSFIFTALLLFPLPVLVIAHAITLSVKKDIQHKIDQLSQEELKEVDRKSVKFDNVIEHAYLCKPTVCEKTYDLSAYPTDNQLMLVRRNRNASNGPTFFVKQYPLDEIKNSELIEQLGKLNPEISLGEAHICEAINSIEP